MIAIFCSVEDNSPYKDKVSCKVKLGEAGLTFVIENKSHTLHRSGFRQIQRKDIPLISHSMNELHCVPERLSF